MAEQRHIFSTDKLLHLYQSRSQIFSLGHRIGFNRRHGQITGVAGTDQVYSEKDIDYWHNGGFLIAKSIHRRSGSLSLELTPGSINETRFSSRFFSEYVDWSGSVERLPAQFYDQPLLPDTTLFFRQGQTALISMHLGASRANDNFQYGIDLNKGLFAPGPHAFLDPGFWIKYPFQGGVAGLSCGMVSAQPDIRGIPSISVIEDRMTLFAIFNYGAGLPNREVFFDRSESALQCSAPYREGARRQLDLKLQYLQPIDRHRYLHQYDAYFFLERADELVRRFNNGDELLPLFSYGLRVLLRF